MDKDNQPAPVNHQGNKMANLLRVLKDGWLMQTEIIDHKALVCKAKFDSAVAKGFTDQQALEICTKEWTF